MMLLGFATLLLPMIAGAFALLAFWVAPSDRLRTFWAMLLGALLGLGLSSIPFPLVVVACGGWPKWYPIAEFLFWAVTASGTLFWWLRVRVPNAEPQPSAKFSFSSLLLALLALLSAGTALLTTLNQYHEKPHGDWDAIYIWNYHARFFYRDQGAHHRNIFALNDHHPEYPLLLPGLVARCWAAAGEDSPVFSASLGAIFYWLAGLILLTSVARHQGYFLAWFALLLYLSPIWVSLTSTAEYADTPLSCWMLAAVLVWLADSTVSTSRVALISGLFAGLAAWTKNEGLPFVVVLVLCILARSVLHEGWRSAFRIAIFFSLGALGPVLLNLWWKSLCPFPNDLVAGQQSPLTKLMDVSRWQQIAMIGSSLLADGYGPVVLFAVVGVCCLGWQRPRGAGLAIATVLLMAGVYLLTYLLTPHEVEWHLKTSLKRLGVHLWPLFLFAMVAGAKRVAPTTTDS